MIKKKKMLFFRMFFKFFFSNKKIAVSGFLVLFLSLISQIMIPLMTQQIIMLATNNLERHQFIIFSFWGLNWTQIIILIFAIVIYEFISQAFSNWWWETFGITMNVRIKSDVFAKFINQDISYYSDKQIGEILTKIITDSEEVGWGFPRVVMTGANSLLTVLVGLIMTFMLDWRIAIVGGCLVILFVIVYGIFYFISKNKMEAKMEIVTDVNADVSGRITAIKLIKASGTEKYETDNFKTLHQKIYKTWMIGSFWFGILNLIVTVGSFISLLLPALCAYLFYGINASQNSEMINNFFITIFPTYTIAQAYITAPLGQFAFVFHDLSVNEVAAKRINDVLTEESKIKNVYGGGKVIKDLNCDISLNNIGFKYPEKPDNLIIKNLNYTFKSGKSYAIVGETGAGKSTISKMLLRLYDPSYGEIYIGEDNLKDLNLSSYLNKIGYVDQEPQIIYGDVFENVKYGSFDATNDDVIETCKKIDMHALIMSWPEGYNTILGENGFKLSGGQKQRLVIARIFLKNPDLIILDEATSSLDNIIEQEIQEELNALIKGKTSITIAHRLSTIQSVDHILVLGKNGEGIVQEGNFKQLLNRPGYFKDLYTTMVNNKQ